MKTKLIKKIGIYVLYKVYKVKISVLLIYQQAISEMGKETAKIKSVMIKSNYRFTFSYFLPPPNYLPNPYPAPFKTSNLKSHCHPWRGWSDVRENFKCSPLLTCSLEWRCSQALHCSVHVKALPLQG